MIDDLKKMNMIFNLKKILAGLVAAILWSSCQKAELPEEVDAAPVFGVSFEAAMSFHALTAGLGGYYLFTRFDYDPFEVVTMRGAFAPDDCPAADCPGTLTFEFRNFEPGAVIETDSFVLPPMAYSFKREPGAIDSIPRLRFAVENSDSASGYFWEIRQANQLVAEGDGPVLLQEFASLEPVEVRLEYDHANGSAGVATSNYLFNQPACPQTSILAIQDSIGNYGLTALVTPSGGIYTYQWNNGVSAAAIFVDSIDIALEHSVTVTDANGCVATASFFNLSAPQQSPLVRISRQDSVTVVDELQLGSVAIQWIQPVTGQVLRSDWGPQPPAASFQVTASWLYERNENGEKTNALRVAFDCLLYNADGQAVPLQGQGEIAVAYPE